MRLKIWIALLALGLLAGCSNDGAEQASTGVPVIIDSDLAAEGFMSILYLIAQEDLDVQAITVSGTGLVHCEAGVNQVLGILEMVGAEPIPVACGPEEPIEGFNTFPTSWRVGADDAYGLELPEGGEPSSLSAPELIVSAVKDSPVPVVIYADGPQTNLAHALRLDPTISSSVEMAFIMGGAFDVPGNTIKNPDAEWNIWVDPIAADEVFRSGIPITLVSLDATNQVPLHMFHIAALEEHQETPAARAVVKMFSGNEQLEAGALFFWDQITAALVADETYATFTPAVIEVVFDEDRSVTGATRKASAGTQVRLAESIDVARLESEFLSTIAGTDVGPITIESDFTGSFDGTEWSLDVPETMSPGQYIIHIANSSDSEIVVAFGWLLGDATPQDIDEGEGTAQPDWYELESFVYGVPRSAIISSVEIASEQTYVIVGLDVTGDTSTTIGIIEVVNG